MSHDYLYKIPDNYQDIITKRSLYDNKFKCFINNCSNIKLDLFNDLNKINDIDDLINKLNELKSMYIKNYGLKIFKYYSVDLDTALNKINIHHKKLLLKIEMIDNLLLYINQFNNIQFNDLFNDINKFKIDYSEDVFNTNNMIEFDQSLFVTSDDYDSDKQLQPLKSKLKNNDPYLAEYSN